MLSLRHADVDKCAGLEDTPMRMAKALAFFTKGYEQDLADVVNEAVFDEPDASGMIIMRDIDVYSLCEHHMVWTRCSVCSLWALRRL